MNNKPRGWECVSRWCPPRIRSHSNVHKVRSVEFCHAIHYLSAECCWNLKAPHSFHSAHSHSATHHVRRTGFVGPLHSAFACALTHTHTPQSRWEEAFNSQFNVPAWQCCWQHSQNELHCAAHVHILMQTRWWIVCWTVLCWRTIYE